MAGSAGEMAGPGEGARAPEGDSGAMTPQATLTNAAVSPREVTAADLPGLATTLAGAFHDDPVFTWWIADEARRREILPEFFRIVAEASLAGGGLYATDDAASGAVWAPPEAEDDEEMVGALAEVSGEYAERLFEVFELMMEQHPTEPHWYLFFLGTRPGFQSRGLGSAVMRPVLEICDEQGLPAYLEATTERNRALYGRHGFEVVGEIRLPGGPSLWPMWREAA
jgi:ribosomal protein S18 acetylase RimI-like enzyme